LPRAVRFMHRTGMICTDLCPEAWAVTHKMRERSRGGVRPIPAISVIEDALRQRRRLTEVVTMEHRRLGCSCRMNFLFIRIREAQPVEHICGECSDGAMRGGADRRAG
jgi:hypothetical protein